MKRSIGQNTQDGPCSASAYSKCMMCKFIPEEDELRCTAMCLDTGDRCKRSGDELYGGDCRDHNKRVSERERATFSMSLKEWNISPQQNEWCVPFFNTIDGESIQCQNDCDNNSYLSALLYRASTKYTTIADHHAIYLVTVLLDYATKSDTNVTSMRSMLSTINPSVYLFVTAAPDVVKRALDPLIGDNVASFLNLSGFIRLVLEPASSNATDVSWIGAQFLSKVSIEEQDVYFMRSIKESNIDVLRLFLTQGNINLARIRDPPMMLAAVIGNKHVIQLLLNDDRFDPTAHRSEAVKIAINYGHCDVLRILLNDSRVKRNATIGWPNLIYAIQKGKACVVRLLLEYRDLHAGIYDNIAIITAARLGHNDVVELLLKNQHVEPTAQNNRALHNAVLNNNYDIVRLLLLDDRVGRTNLFTARDVAHRRGYYDIVNLIDRINVEYSDD
jgi:hypothetical protein